MTYYEEILQRLAERMRIEKNLSSEAYEEVVLNIGENPQEFLLNKEDESYLYLALGLERYNDYLLKLADENMGDPEMSGITSENVESGDRLLKQSYQGALKIYPDNIDAQYLKLLHSGENPGIENLVLLRGLVEKYESTLDNDPSIFTRPYQRLQAAYISALVQNAAYTLAIAEGDRALAYDIEDPFGVRHSLSLCFARLENLPAFEKLEEIFERTSNSWSYLGRIILMYRLNNLSAAKRAITGYTKLVPGAAHLFLQGSHRFPIPRGLGRAQVPTCSFKECVIATSEAYEIIEDTPGLREWANSIEQVRDSALDFQNSIGF